jgi:hypothetical protein
MCEYEHGCVRKAADNELMLCAFHLEQAKSEAQDAFDERRIDRATDDGRGEYPRFYDGH